MDVSYTFSVRWLQHLPVQACLYRRRHNLYNFDLPFILQLIPQVHREEPHISLASVIRRVDQRERDDPEDAGHVHDDPAVRSRLEVRQKVGDQPDGTLYIDGDFLVNDVKVDVVAIDLTLDPGVVDNAVEFGMFLCDLFDKGFEAVEFSGVKDVVLGVVAEVSRRFFEVGFCSTGDDNLDFTYWSFSFICDCAIWLVRPSFQA